jgi:hypothetical protein
MLLVWPCFNPVFKNEKEWPPDQRIIPTKTIHTHANFVRDLRLSEAKEFIYFGWSNI